jgi:hypothetical protein
MRRVWIVLTVIAVATALAIPAAAVKPVKADNTPLLYEVTMTFVENEAGLSTHCDDEVSILMLGTAGPTGLSLWDTDTPLEAPLIHVRAPEVDWERTYPTPSSSSSSGETGFDECHGPSVYDGVYDDPDHPFSDHGGALSITIDYDEGTVDFLWHFDYYIDAEDLGKNKPRWVATVRENYTMSATASYNTATGLVEGSFPVSWSLKEGRVLIHSYDLFEPIEGMDMTFNLTVTPIER